MKKGLIILSAAIILFVIYMPISMSWLLSEHQELSKRKIAMSMYGVQVKGEEEKLCIKFSEFTEYIPDQDYINDFNAHLWHARDTLYIELIGRDAYPGLHKIFSKEAYDSLNDISAYDRVKISIDEGRTKKTHLNYGFSFGGIALVAKNVDGQFVQGSRQICDIPWKMEAKGQDWTLFAAIPLHGKDNLGLNIVRKYYGGREVGLVPENNPNNFVLVHLI